MTDNEVIQLYTISGFNLGSSVEEQLNSVNKLRSLSFSKFQSSFSDILSTKPTALISNSIDLSPILSTIPLEDTVPNV